MGHEAFAGLCIPDMDVAIMTASEHQAAVGAELRREQSGLVPDQCHLGRQRRGRRSCRPLAVPRGGVPDPGSTVAAGGDQACAVVAEVERGDRPLVADQGGEQLASLRVVDPPDTVATPRDHDPPIGAERGSDRGVVTIFHVRSSDLLRVLQIDHDHLSP